MRLAEAICQQTDLPEPVARILAQRAVPPEAAEAYLAPKLKELLPNPSSLRDMERAAERLIAAVKRRERIAVFADYDVDGGTSAALLIDWLHQQGRQATLYIPCLLYTSPSPRDA